MITGHLTAPLDIQTRTTDGKMFIDIVPFGYRQAVMSFDVEQSQALIDKLVFLRNVQLNYQPEESE
jgi:hypothetical protein